MLKLYKRSFIVLLLILTIILLWNEVDSINYNKGNSNKSLMNLSILPKEISQSLELLNKRANDLQKDLAVRKGFTFTDFKLAGERYIAANTPLIIQTYYKKSDSLVQEIITMPDNFVGLTINELNNITEQWEVKEYSEGKLMILYRSLDQISPKDKKNIHLGIRDGRVAIFYGESGQHNLKKLTEIEIDDLSLQEQEDLKDGITINSNEELLSILDSLISSISMD